MFVNQVASGGVAHDVRKEQEIVGSLVPDDSLPLAIGVAGVSPKHVAEILVLSVAVFFLVPFLEPDIGVGPGAEFHEPVAHGYGLVFVLGVGAEEVDRTQRDGMEHEPVARLHFLYLLVSVGGMEGKDGSRAFGRSLSERVASLRPESEARA